MSADAFAVALAKGSCIEKPRFRDALRTGAIFGIVEGITPIIGWCLGLAASSFIAEFDHWVAFLILSAIGLKLIYEAAHPDAEECEIPARSALGLTILTAIGTSIDALAVGVTLAFLSMNIWVAALCIGAATTLMATIGIMLGHRIGSKYGAAAEVFGGICLITIGTHILFTHMHVI